MITFSIFFSILTFCISTVGLAASFFCFRSTFIGIRRLTDDTSEYGRFLTYFGLAPGFILLFTAASGYGYSLLLLTLGPLQ